MRASYASGVETTLSPAPQQQAPAVAGLDIAVLGPVEVRRDGIPVDIGTPKQRALLAALALSHGRPVSVDALVDLLWDHAPPASATGTLQAYVSGLRKTLEPGRARRAAAGVLVTTAPGYALRLPEDGSDAERFERCVTEEHARLAMPLLGPAPLPSEELESAVARLDQALAGWRGRPYAELDEASAAVAERAHLEELRAVAQEDRAVARLALGDHAGAAAELELLTTSYPMRERLWALRTLALVRSGRQAEALEVLRQVRQVLTDELGIDPGVELRQLQEQVLRQDPALAWSPPAGGTPPPPAARSPRAPTRTTAGAAGDWHEGISAPDWPLLGRDAEIGLLEEALEQALTGRTTCAVVTGEPGIGKSRLCAEAASRAGARGVDVLVGRCSQDDGAPPLWPWSTILDRLGSPRAVVEEAQSGEFRVWERITREIRDAASRRPVLLLLDDLHWADTATLRVLRLLLETSHDDRLLVVATWRDQPRPTGALADVAETMARRHAVRVELTGLDDPAVAAVVVAVTDRRPTRAETGALRRRTEGNPFFLIEYARLAESRTDLSALLAEDHPPTAVQEVLARRLDRMPAGTVEALRTAAVVGRRFDVATVAAATGEDEEDLLDRIDPALAAGLVREDGVDRFVFAHALVRDAIYTGTSPSRRARRHARVAAHVAGRPGRETEAARHWLAAGPSYAAHAWRSAVAAVDVARRAHAHEEAAELCRAALEVMADDPSATPRDRYDLLMSLVAAYRWSARWNDLTPTVEQAITVAEQMGDPVLVAEAAVATTHGALWQSAPHGEVHHEIVAALRRSLERLPEEDSALRCRCMLSLSDELYYASTNAERRALVDEALAMARRLDDAPLLLHAYQAAFLSLWCPSTARERLDLADQAVQVARTVDDQQGAVLALTLRAVALGELGMVPQMWETVAAARVEAERLRVVYALLVLDSMVIAWHAMAGRFEVCEQIFDGLLRLVAGASLRHSDDAVAGALVAMALWQGRTEDAAQGVGAIAEGPLPVDSLLVHLLWRSGHEDRARAHYAHHPVTLDDNDWFSTLNWCNAGAAALYVDDPSLAARVYDLLAPLAGHSCSAGSGNASGPVDGYLAMAAAAAGDRELASRHADDAERLAEEWQIPLFTQWLREQRDRFSF